MRLVNGHLDPLGAGHPHAHALVLRLGDVEKVRGAHAARLPLGLHRELHRPMPPRRSPRRARSRPRPRRGRRRRRAAFRRQGPGWSPASASGACTGGRPARGRRHPAGALEPGPGLAVLEPEHRESCVEALLPAVRALEEAVHHLPAGRTDAVRLPPYARGVPVGVRPPCGQVVGAHRAVVPGEGREQRVRGEPLASEEDPPPSSPRPSGRPSSRPRGGSRSSGCACRRRGSCAGPCVRRPTRRPRRGRRGAGGAAAPPAPRGPVGAFPRAW